MKCEYYMRNHIHACMHTYIRTCICTCTYGHTCVLHMRTYMCLCIYRYVFIHVTCLSIGVKNHFVYMRQSLRCMYVCVVCFVGADCVLMPIHMCRDVSWLLCFSYTPSWAFGVHVSCSLYHELQSISWIVGPYSG